VHLFGRCQRISLLLPQQFGRCLTDGTSSQPQRGPEVVALSPILLGSRTVGARITPPLFDQRPHVHGLPRSGLFFDLLDVLVFVFLRIVFSHGFERMGARLVGPEYFSKFLAYTRSVER
jgi:hypothetical protein